MRKYKLICLILFTLVMTACKPSEQIYPTLTVSDVSVLINSEFDEFDGVGCETGIDNDMTESYTVTMNGVFDISTTGVYYVSYTCENEFGNTDTKSRLITVFDYELASGYYDYRLGNSDARLAFLSASERYLMERQIGGINLFTSASHITFSSRFNPGLDDYIPVVGFDVFHGTMLGDDKNVDFLYDYVGVENEYTYRSNISFIPYQFNQFIYDTSVEEQVLEHIYGSLYKFAANEENNGFEIQPSMAGGNPILLDPSLDEYGVDRGTVWRIPVRDDLQWYFHPDVPQAFLDMNPDSSITAEDFINTFKLSLDEEWFRAMFGGGDFVSSISAIEGVEEYKDGTASWNDVGLKVINEDGIEYIEITFVSDQTEFDVMYYYSSFVKTPVNIDLYNYVDSLGELYGSDYTKVAYHGAFYVDAVEENHYIHLKENPNYYSDDEYSITGIMFYEIEDARSVFDAFLDGYLESAPIPISYGTTDSYDCCVDVWTIPGSTVYRININGLSTVEAQQEQFPDSDFIPEPILATDSFKLAMFHALDREYLTSDLLNDSKSPTMYYYSSAFLADWPNGVVYRDTIQGQSVGEGLDPNTYGFNSDKAVEYFKEAVEQLIQEGTLEVGNASEYTVIDLGLITYTGSPSWDIVAEYVENQYETLFVDDENFVRINIDVEQVDFPSIYYDYQMVGNFDLGFGGISGNLLCPICYEHMFSSDNRSGFLLSWGNDTSIPEIEVEYIDHEGVLRYEIFSYDAIGSLANGGIYIYEGMEFDGPRAEITSVTEESLTFTISNWGHEIIEDLTYTLQTYDWDTGDYLDVEGYIDVEVTVPSTTISGLDSFMFSMDEFGNEIYQGDYRIVVEFDYIEIDEGEVHYSDWVQLESLIQETGDQVITTTSFFVPVDVFGTLVVTEFSLYEEQTNGSYLLIATEDSLGENIDLQGLELSTKYVVKMILADGQVFYLNFRTHAVD